MVDDWTILKREPVQDFGIFQVHSKHVRSPRTGNVRKVQAIQTPDWVLVLALTPDEEVMMVRQYRHGIEQICLELPGGLVDSEDPSPAVAAQRELLEETGYQSPELILIGECFPQPAVLSNGCFFFLAKDAEKIRESNLDDGEDIEIIKVPLKSILHLIETGEINHGMVLLAFSFFWLKYGQVGRA